MSIIGPRPLLVTYLPRYNEFQQHRHDVRPGLTGYAQAHGRNAVSWEDKFAMDVWYTKHITFRKANLKEYNGYTYEVLQELLPMQTFFVDARDIDTPDDYDRAIEWAKSNDIYV